MSDHSHRRFNPLLDEWVLGSPQRDLTPEEAAARLQAVGEVHYQARAGAEARP